METFSDPMLRVPEPRAAALGEIAERLAGARRVVLTTHVNADGDGTGSEAAVAEWLEAQGGEATIVNPTPFPELFRFVLHRPEVVADWGSEDAERAIREADLFLVLDTSEPGRVGALADHLPPGRTIVVDHHPPGATTVGEMALQDPAAAATGELARDLLTVAGAEWTPTIAAALYVALVTDTGSFRYSNTSPRAHRLAAELLERGVDPEAMYRRLFATVPLRRIEVLREALATLRFDADAGIAWIVVTQELIQQAGATPDDLDGLGEHARSIEGAKIAILFRETPEGETKISFRANSAVDVNRIARRFGGGGHVRASGALVPGSPGEVAPRVLAAVREALGE